MNKGSKERLAALAVCQFIAFVALLVYSAIIFGIAAIDALRKGGVL